ncbi:hypothetical protein [Micromonospora sp. NPDC005979]|uniref:hypothetical protein n=1 Tax=Micromonospora sp. NPDC005979 TaxID=3156726 RepID=UPI0033A023E5
MWAHLDQHLLRHLLRLRRVAYDAAGQPEDAADHGAVQRRERNLVTPCHPRQQLVGAR